MGDISTKPFKFSKKETHTTNKTIHQKEKIIHQKEKIIQEKIIHQKEEIIHQKEEIIHQKEEIIHKKEKEEIIHQKEMDNYTDDISSEDSENDDLSNIQIMNDDDWDKLVYPTDKWEKDSWNPLRLEDTTAKKRYGVQFATAIYYKDIDTINKLLEQEIDLEICDTNGNNALMLAIGYKFRDLVKLLLGRGVDISYTNNEGANATHITCLNGDTRLLCILLWLGSNPNTPIRTSGDTPLHIAAYKGHLKIVKMLIHKNVKLTSRNINNQTPLDCAKEGKKSCINDVDKTQFKYFDLTIAYLKKKMEQQQQMIKLSQNNSSTFNFNQQYRNEINSDFMFSNYNNSSYDYDGWDGISDDSEEYTMNDDLDYFNYTDNTIIDEENDDLDYFNYTDNTIIDEEKDYLDYFNYTDNTIIDEENEMFWNTNYLNDRDDNPEMIFHKEKDNCFQKLNSLSNDNVVFSEKNNTNSLNLLYFCKKCFNEGLNISTGICIKCTHKYELYEECPWCEPGIISGYGSCNNCEFKLINFVKR